MGDELHYAVQTGFVKRVEALIAAGADLEARSKERSMTALLFAAKDGNAPCVTEHIAGGADVNARTNDGHTALMFAAEHGNLGSATSRIAASADVNFYDRNWKIALDLVHPRVRRMLLAARATPNAVRMLSGVASELGFFAIRALSKRR